MTPHRDLTSARSTSSLRRKRRGPPCTLTSKTQRAARRENAETRDASGFSTASHYAWGGPGDGTRSRDEMRALDVLGLESDADFDAVRTAWRTLAKSNHPDVRPGDADAATRFQAIQAAYEVLRAAEEARTWRPRESATS